MISEQDLKEELASYADLQLTAREHEALHLLAEGLSYEGMARRMGVTTGTAKFHVVNLLDKLGGSRCRAVYLGVKLGLL